MVCPLQNAKYEEHTRNLSLEIMRLNEKILEQQKQIDILRTKQRHFQDDVGKTTAFAAVDDSQPFKRSLANFGSNLPMEDEEGEVFNNTNLTDLKLGSVPNMTYVNCLFIQNYCPLIFYVCSQLLTKRWRTAISQFVATTAFEERLCGAIWLGNPRWSQ